LILDGKIGKIRSVKVKKCESVKVKKCESVKVTPPLIPPRRAGGKFATPLVFPPAIAGGRIANPPLIPSRIPNSRDKGAGGKYWIPHQVRDDSVGHKMTFTDTVMTLLKRIAMKSRNSLLFTGNLLIFIILAFLSSGCKAKEAVTDDSMRIRRMDMVKSQIEARGVADSLVIKAMLKVPRDKFVPEPLQALAYSDSPLPIGEDQTISQPYIVAYMTEALRLKPQDKVLEIGTGSGYQAAVLAEMVDSVFTIEIIESLGKSAEARLQHLGYKNIVVKIGDGYQGWEEEAPFDAIIVTAAPEEIPPPLLEQLKEGGRLVIPVGVEYQELVRITKTSDGFIKESLLPVRFVPMTGEAQKK
jgi:protein-L-isoaspartate(D-aspartate) O-methyltransferase